MASEEYLTILVFIKLTVWGRSSDLEEGVDSALEYDTFEQVLCPAKHSFSPIIFMVLAVIFETLTAI